MSAHEDLLAMLLIHSLIRDAENAQVLASLEEALKSPDVSTVFKALQEAALAVFKDTSIFNRDAIRKALIDAISPAFLSNSFPWLKYGVEDTASARTRSATSASTFVPTSRRRSFFSRLFGAQPSTFSEPKSLPDLTQSSSSQEVPVKLVLPADTVYHVPSLFPAPFTNPETLTAAIKMYSVICQVLSHVACQMKSFLDKIETDPQRHLDTQCILTILAIPRSFSSGQSPVNMPSSLFSAEVATAVNDLLSNLASLLQNVVARKAYSKFDADGDKNQPLDDEDFMVARMGGPAGIKKVQTHLKAWLDAGSPSLKFQISHLLAIFASIGFVNEISTSETVWPFVLWTQQNPQSKDLLKTTKIVPHDIVPLLLSNEPDCHLLAIIIGAGCDMDQSLRSLRVVRSRLEESVLQPWPDNGLPNILRIETYTRRGLSEADSFAFVRWLHDEISVFCSKMDLDDVQLPTKAAVISGNRFQQASDPSSPVMATRSMYPTLPSNSITSLPTSEPVAIASPVMFGFRKSEWVDTFSVVAEVDLTTLTAHLSDFASVISALGADEIDDTVAEDLVGDGLKNMKTALEDFIVSWLKDHFNENSFAFMAETHVFYFLLATLCRCAFIEFQDSEEEIMATVFQESAIPWLKDVLLMASHHSILLILNPESSVAEKAQFLLKQQFNLARKLLTGAIINRAVVHIAQHDLPLTLNTLFDAILWVSTVPDQLRDRLEFIMPLQLLAAQTGSASTQNGSEHLERFRSQFVFYPEEIENNFSTEPLPASSTSSASLQTTTVSSSTTAAASSSKGKAPAKDDDDSTALKRFISEYRGSFPISTETTIFGELIPVYNLTLEDGEYEQLYFSTYKAVGNLTLDQLRRKRPQVSLIHQEGRDAGGLTKYWLARVAVQMTNLGKHTGLLIDIDENATGQRTIHPLADLVPDSENFFNLLGKLIGITLVNSDIQAFMPLDLSTSMYALLLGHPLTAAYYESLDRTLFSHVNSIFRDANNISDLGLTMSVDIPLPAGVTAETARASNIAGFGSCEGGVVSIGVVPDGQNIDVETPQDLIALVEHRARLFFGSHAPNSCRAFVNGFRLVCPLPWLRQLDPVSLLVAIEGNRELDVNDWQANTRVTCDPRVANHPEFQKQSAHTIKLFWEIVGSFSSEERVKLLQFVTGQTRCPAGGFACLIKPFTIQIEITPQVTQKNEMHAPLPVAHVCFNRLDLVLFTSINIFRQKLLQAIVVEQFNIK